MAEPAPVDASAARSFQQIELDETALAENNVLPQITDASALRAYKILRTRLLRRLEANQWRTLAVTGVTAGDGKTLTAINLAIALSQDVSTWVFLVDLDLHRPRIAEYMGMAGMHGSKGLSDYLLGGCDAREHHVFAQHRATRDHSELSAGPERLRAAECSAYGGPGAAPGS